jgi:hypothetical protein
VSSVDIDGEVPANGSIELDGAYGGWRGPLYRLGTYLGSCDRAYRITLSRAERRLCRNPSHFREWAIFAVFGLVAQFAILAAGFGYFFAAEQEHQRIVEQKRQQEQRQRELDRQSYFVRVVPDIAEHGEF